jgi:hypothetical protein
VFRLPKLISLILRFYLKFVFLIIETEIVTLKKKIGPSVNQQFQFGFRFNRSNQNKITLNFIDQHGE